MITPRKVYKLIEVEMKDVKEGDKIIMFEDVGSLVCRKDGAFIFTALSDATDSGDGVWGIKTKE